MSNIFFEKSGVSPSGKTNVYDVYPNGGGNSLGNIKWYAPWRRYCFHPEDSTLFDVSCLNDICDFITQLMQERTK